MTCATRVTSESVPAGPAVTAVESSTGRKVGEDWRAPAGVPMAPPPMGAGGSDQPGVVVASGAPKPLIGAGPAAGGAGGTNGAGVGAARGMKAPGDGGTNGAAGVNDGN